MERVVIPELLDSDAGTAEEIAASLRDLRWINGWFGGVRTETLLLADAMKAASLTHASVLSVACGDASALLLAAKSLRRRGLAIDVTASDRSPAHLAGSQVQSRAAADALALPFADASFDFVECTLFAHHLEPEEVIRFGREALRVARYALLINDVRRSRVHWAFAALGGLLYRSRLTRHDAPASVRRAYTSRELERLLRRSGARRVSVQQRWFFRTAASAWNDRP